MTKPTLYRAEYRSGNHFAATWWVAAPWAHPVWSEYAVLLYDLRTSKVQKPAILYKDGVTHEMQVFALNPEHPYRPSDRVADLRLLTPANHGYQFTAVDDSAAVLRVRTLVEMIERKELSPDTDYRAIWDDLFKDGVSLRQSMFTEFQSARSAVRH